MLRPEDNELLTRVGPGTPMGELLRAFWIPCLLAEEVAEPDGEPVRVTILGEELVAFRDTSGAVGLIDAYCPHRGAPLFFGRNEDCGLRCIYHGWKFDASGACVDMPNEPAASNFKEKVQLVSYPTREAGGVVWAYMGPQDTPPELPGLEWLELPPEHVYVDKSIVECNFLQTMEGDHDSSHASLLHSTLDNRLEDEFRMKTTRLTEVHMRDKAPELQVMETDFGFVTGARRRATEQTSFWRMTTWLMPFYNMIAVEPGTSLTLNVRVPIDDEHTWNFRVAYNPAAPLSEREVASYQGLGQIFQRMEPGSFRPVANRDNDYLIDRMRQRHETFSGIEGIPTQDRAVTERMRWTPRTGRAVVDRSREHLGSSDISIITLRRRLKDLAVQYQRGQAPQPLTRPELYRVRAPAVELPNGVPFDEGAARHLAGKGPWDSSE